MSSLFIQVLPGRCYLLYRVEMLSDSQQWEEFPGFKLQGTLQSLHIWKAIHVAEEEFPFWDFLTRWGTETDQCKHILSYL
jgi:hypothetical protein